MVVKIGRHGRSDQLVILAVLVLLVVGLLAVSSASVVLSYDRYGNNFVYLKNQIIFVAVGLDYYLQYLFLASVVSLVAHELGFILDQSTFNRLSSLN